jgi:hypothetical protein
MEQIKVMVTGDKDGVLWDIKTENEIDLNHTAYGYIAHEIDLSKWKKDYLDLYRRWLINDDESVYQINHSINMEMISVLAKINKMDLDFKLYYWFDVDRDKCPDYIWENCPLSGERLINISSHLTSKISPISPLVFPVS